MAYNGYDKDIQELRTTVNTVTSHTTSLSYVAGRAPVTITGDTTLTAATHRTVICDASSNTIAVTLPDASAALLGARFRIVASDATNDITVGKHASDTLTLILARDVLQDTGEWADFECDGVDTWYLTAFGTITAEA